MRLKFLSIFNAKYLFLMFIVVMSLFPMSAISESKQATLTIDVIGAISNQGQVILSVFDSEQSHLKIPKLTQTAPVTAGGQTQFVIPDLDLGIYSISVIHDENENGALDTNFLGIPSELVGSSNNVKSLFGPPSFKESAFELSVSEKITIKLIDVLD